MVYAGAFLATTKRRSRRGTWDRACGGLARLHLHAARDMSQKEMRSYLMAMAELAAQIPLWSGDPDERATTYLAQLAARYRAIVKARGVKARRIVPRAPIVMLSPTLGDRRKD